MQHFCVIFVRGLDLKVKVCGMRVRENIEEISALKPDYMGFIFYPDSKRYVGEDFLVENLLKLECDKVGVFVNQSEAEIIDKIALYSLQAVQLHGEESPEFCKKLQKETVKVIKAFGVSTVEDFTALSDYSDSCDLFLFDTKSEQRGGTGEKFDWTILDSYSLSIPFLLAGGIGPEDIPVLREKYIKMPLFHGVDANSKVESEPGVKDLNRVRALIEEVRK